MLICRSRIVNIPTPDALPSNGTSWHCLFETTVTMTVSLFSTFVIVGCFLANVGVSNGYLYSRLCQESTLLVRAVFVGTFALSGSLLQLCLWEINGSLQNEYFLVLLRY